MASDGPRQTSLAPGVLQLYKKRKIMQGRGKSGKQALNLTEEMVYEMNR